MKYKKLKIFIIIIMLIICSLIISKIINDRRKSEINAAKSFIQQLQDNQMISSKEELSKIKYKSTKKNEGINVDGYYKVYSDNYDIELDLNKKVIGFKNKQAKCENVEISINEAKEIAEKYVETIVDEDVFFKQISPKDENVPYYSFVFTKYLNGFPCYSDDIIVNIDKSEGLLDGYSNYSTPRNPKDVHIYVLSSEAEKICIDDFNSVNSTDKSAINGETFKAYALNKDKTESELCYIVSVSGKGDNGNDIKFKYFVSTETGDIINMIKDTVSETSY